jgi:asparagine synthase (glutamine-hydrolysing)
MFLAVVHVSGSDAARNIVDRARRVAGEPDAIATGFTGAVAGWHRAAPLNVAAGYVVEGWFDAPFPIENLSQVDFDRSLSLAKGDFALCILGQNRLTAASGPGGGHRPLFVVIRNEWVAASTRLRVILSLLECPPPLDIDYLASAVTVDYPIELAATPFAGIHHVPLGEAWVLHPGVSEERHSTLLDPPRDPAHGTEHDHALALREAIERAVTRATRGTSKVGVALSGGLDSSSVFVTLDSLRRTGRISTEFEGYSWDFDTPDAGDDRPYRLAVQRKVGAPTHPIAPEEAGPFARPGMVLDAMPCTDVPCGLWLALDRAAQKSGINRILTGAGGDNVLEGNPALFSELAMKGAPLQAVHRAVRLRGVGGSSPWWRVSRFVVRPLIQAALPASLRTLHRRARNRRWFDWMGPRFRPWLQQRALRPSPALAITLDSSPAERYCALARMPFLADIALLRGQQEEATQYYRIDPLFDDEILRAVATLPPLTLFAGGYRRGLLRESMSGLLPEELKTRARKAYMEPALARMIAADGGFERLRNLASVRRLADLGLVEPGRFRKHFDRLARNPLGALWTSVWPALATEEFLRQYDEGWAS